VAVVELSAGLLPLLCLEAGGGAQLLPPGEISRSAGRNIFNNHHNTRIPAITPKPIHNFELIFLLSDGVDAADGSGASKEASLLVV
jgi:hypothetical protein